MAVVPHRNEILADRNVFSDLDEHTPVPLRNQEPLGGGSQSHVYLHPADPDLIIKVPHNVYVERRSGKWSWRWYKKYWRRRLRVRHYIAFQREITEQFATRALEGVSPPYLQGIVGFVETDLGMGMVFRCVRTRSGDLAPTLRTMLLQGRFGEDVQRRLEEFFDWLIASPIVVGDLNSGNIVYGHDAEKGDVFVLIDGIGDKNVVPLNSYSPALNRRSKQRRIGRLRMEIEQILDQVRAADPGKPRQL